MIYQQATAVEEHARMVDDFLQRGSQQSFYSGRPDFLILEYDGPGTQAQLREVTLGEVKYTASDSTFASGLRELLEYLHFAQENGAYLFEEPDVTVQGILCTDGVSTDTETVDYITHHTTEDLRRWAAGGID
jgi:hypothetical protein